MCVDISHLVFETLGNTDDQVVDEGTDGSESSNVLAGAVVQLNLDDILLYLGEVYCQMAEILLELAYFEWVRFANWLIVDRGRSCKLPLGPSTVTWRDLMATLTIQLNPSVSGLDLQKFPPNVPQCAA